MGRGIGSVTKCLCPASGRRRNAITVAVWPELDKPRQGHAVWADLLPGLIAAQDLGPAAAIDFAGLRWIHVRAGEGVRPSREDPVALVSKNCKVASPQIRFQSFRLRRQPRAGTRPDRGDGLSMPNSQFLYGNLLPFRSRRRVYTADRLSEN